jgi:hypothetical protein
MSDYYIHVDEKVTTWLRHTVKVENCSSYKEAVEKVIKAIQDDNLYSSDSVEPVDSEELCDTETSMTIEENEGFHTVEILDEEYQPIWDNVNKWYEIR